MRIQPEPTPTPTTTPEPREVASSPTPPAAPSQFPAGTTPLEKIGRRFDLETYEIDLDKLARRLVDEELERMR